MNNSWWFRSMRWRGWPLVIGLGLTALTLALWQHQRSTERERLQAVVDGGLHETVLRVQQRMMSYELLLQSTQAFVLADAPPNARAFKQFVDMLPLGAQLPGVQGLGLAQWLPATERPSQAWLREGRPLAAILPPGTRDAYAPVIQLEPDVPRNLGALGRDLLADAGIRETLLAARDSGHMAVTPRLALSGLLRGAPAGFLLVLPIYEAETLPASVAQRQASLRGWVWAPVLVGEFMGSLHAELPRGLRLRLFEGQVLSDAQLLFDSGTAPSGAALLPPVLEYLDIGGRTWTLSLELGERYAGTAGLRGSTLLLVSGIGLALLMAALSWSLLNSQQRAQQLAGNMTQALRESERRWAFALEGAGDGMWDCDLPSGRVECSDRWKLLMGWPGGEPRADQLLSLVHADDMARVRADFIACLKGQTETLQCEFRVRGPRGQWPWVLARGRVVQRGLDGRALRMIGTLSDIDARRQSEEQVRFMASHDPLTELANRAHFGERMHYALANARRYGDSLGLILLDLDRFKPVNDQYGHAVGDQLLQTVARRLRHAVRETDVVGRIGGDEFVVLLTGPVTRESAQVVVDKIFNQVAQPMELSGHRLELTCSIGLALYPEDGVDEIALTKSADEAMYRSKKLGRAWLGGELRAP